MLAEPLIQIVLAFIVGIVIGNYLPLSSFFALYSTIILLFFLALLLFLSCSARLSASPISEPKRFALQRKYISPTLLLFAFLLFGAAHLQNYRSISCFDISRFIPGEYSLVGTIIEEPEINKFKTKLILRAETVLSEKGKKKVTGKVWVSAKYSRDEIKKFHYGDKIKIRNANLSQPPSPANPGEFDFRNWLSGQKIYTIVTVKPSDLKKIGSGRSNSLLKYSYFLKAKIEKIIERSIVGEPEISIIKAMVLGQSELPDFIRKPFLKTGIFHVLVVSGLHVGFIVIFIALFTPFLSSRWKEGFAIAAIIFYCLITGAKPPVFRASLMVIIYLLGRLLNRESSSYLAIALAALILLLFNPEQLFAPGFQLSFIVTLGILLLAPVLIGKLPERIPLFLKGAIAVPIAAQLTAWPLVAFHFHYFSPLAIFTNILLIPLAGLDVGLSFLTIFFGSVFANIGAIFGASVYLLTAILFKLTKLFAQLPLAYQEIGGFSLRYLFSYYAIFILLFNFTEQIKRERAKVLCLSLLLLFNLFFWPKAATKMRAQDFAVTVLKVPDGNCLFLQFPDKKNGLIIGDEDNYRSVEKIIKPFLFSQSVGTIDYLFLDQSGDNHLGSLLQLSRHFKIRQIIDVPEASTSITYKNFSDKITLLSRKKYFLGYQKARENQVLIRSDLGYWLESLGSGVYRLTCGGKTFLIGMSLTEDSLSKLLSLKKDYSASTLILPALPRKKKTLNQLIRRTKATEILLTRSTRKETLHPHLISSPLEGEDEGEGEVKVIFVQNQGAIHLE
ncbi:MAG: hypothetical protein COS11_05940 [bacterium (Candidatus Ratteibacteria) CG01_land_8_20_14_3_00_40_19]|uniref:ComEC/Rec2-related protein domain-containing protein n=1 Tax=bacterium (Candidatus Ratteibacteria) CG01_land_8_20_14_3_00_40_19 TaxID=2014290 RepID=A0A2M7E7Q8_9BACT|nr:MAG: hypothetical protein AUJ76_03930 [Candidatus Omnitrophica bacterium CG1_02_41_171]PIV63721.1 MAG: hypothetical protein COS11_05940 [bacterium (Candidatus Ratteibacteria) CG01_land_8_20_14_3_00_40_19]HCG77165.1 hypothetical protein [bacterium]